MERSNKKPRVPTSQGCHQPLPFPQLLHPSTGGWAQVRRSPPSGAKPGMRGLRTPAARPCTHKHTCAHTCTCTEHGAGLCISGGAGGGSTGCSLLSTCSLNSLPSRLSAVQEVEVPMPCGRHPCLPRLPGASPRHDRSTKPRDTPPPTFYQPLGPPRVGFLTEVPLELRWEGGILSSQNRPHLQGEETVMWWDFLCRHRTSEHLSLSRG